MSFKSFRCVATVALVLASVGVPSAQDTVSATNTTSTNSCAGSVGAGITPAHYFDLDKVTTSEFRDLSYIQTYLYNNFHVYFQMMGTWYIHTVWIGDAADVREPDGRCQDTVFARRGPLLVGSTEHFINRTDNTNRTIESESRIEENKLQSIWASYLNSSFKKSFYMKLQ